MSASKVVSLTGGGSSSAASAPAKKAEQPRVVTIQWSAEPAKKVLPPVPKKVMAWSGGVMTTNKDEARSKFAQKLEKKRQAGDTLTAGQLEIIAEWKRNGGEAASESADAGAKRKRPMLGPPPGKGKRGKRGRGRGGGGASRPGRVAGGGGGIVVFKGGARRGRGGARGGGRGAKTQPRQRTQSLEDRLSKPLGGR